jgi:hypothetical protein
LARAATAVVYFDVDIVPTTAVSVQPGGSVGYQIVGHLSGDASLGLALWGIDLHSSYSIPNGLPQAMPGPELWSFVRPYGLTNPAGYGGTPNGDDWLWQLGGGQNTIGNTGPSFPNGPVVEGVGLSPVVLAYGQANLPADPGAYALTLSTLFANSLREPNGLAYYVDEAVGRITTPTLSMTVLPEPSLGFLMLSAAGIFAARRRARSA